MKVILFFVAVLLSAEAATLVKDVTHKVTVPIPGNVLAEGQHNGDVEVPAVVVEVSKDHVHNPDEVQKPMLANLRSHHEVANAGNPQELPVVAEVQGSVQSTISDGTKPLGSPAVVSEPTVHSVVEPVVVSEPALPSVVEPVVPVVVSEPAVHAAVELVTLEPPVVPVVVSKQDINSVVDPVVVTNNVNSVTVVPLVNDVVTEISGETTLAPDTEEVATDITTTDPEDESHTTDAKTESFPDTTINPINTNEPVVVVTPLSSVVNENSNEDSKEHKSQEYSASKEHNKSKENSSNESSSSQESHEDVHKLQSQVVVPSIPPITEDLANIPSDVASSAESVKPSLASVPLETDKVVVRQRRNVVTKPVVANPSKDASDECTVNKLALSCKTEKPVKEKEEEQPHKVNKVHRRAIPLNDPKVVISPSIKPKLETNPQVIAEILAKSKNQQKRYKKSIAPKDTNVPVPVTEESLIKKIDASEFMPSTSIDPCDLLCTKFEFEPVCASNSLCLHEFPNNCMLDTYNCKHPTNKFGATKDDRCQMHWLDFCKEEDL